MNRTEARAQWKIPDAEHPFDGTSLTIGQRFAGERAKFEGREGIALAEAFRGTGVISKQRLRAIEEFNARIEDKLWRFLIGMRFDVHYILYGERILTEAEQAVRDVIRLASTKDRAALIAHAETLMLHVREMRDAYGELAYLADEEGRPLGHHAVVMVEG